MADEYSLGEDPKTGNALHAEDVYDELAGPREQVITMGRVMAELTIPSVFPPEGYRTGDEIAGNNQSISAICVNNLASKLQFVAFPPGRPFLNYEPITYKLQAQLEQDPEAASLIDLALSRLAMEHLHRFSVTPIPATYTEFCKALLVAGNALWKQVKIDNPCFYNLTQYVVKRDRQGNVLLVILKEPTSVVELEDSIRTFVLDATPEVEDDPEWSQVVDIYTCCKLKVSGGKKSWEYWQEYSGNVIPGTSYLHEDFYTPPLFAAWMIPVYGQDWGRSYCEEYRGDLFAVENFMSALNDGAAAAALTMWFVAPGSRTTVKQVKEAENLSVLSGSAEDVTALRLDKTGDFQFVSNTVIEAAKRLYQAFLMQRAVQRPGERVTAEEIKRLGIDLDMAMGGLYTSLSSGAQRYVVKRFVVLHEDENQELPIPPPDLVRTEIATGVGALGQNLEDQNLTDLGAEMNMMFGPLWTQQVNVIDWARRKAAAKGVNPQGLFKDPRQMAQEKAQIQSDVAKQTLLEKTAGPVSGEFAKAAASHMMPGQPGQPATQQGAAANGGQQQAAG